MNKVIIFFLSLLFLHPITLRAQWLTLDQAYQMAKENYPLIKQRELIRKSGQYSMENIAKGALPQFSIAGQATYQSEVTEIPIKLPNQDLPQISKDQYRIYGELVQPLTDLITVKHQKEIQEATMQYATDDLETELYKVRDRVNALYFAILLLEEQRRQNALTKQDIQNGINKVNAAIQHGTDFRSSADKLKAESLKIDQRDIELTASRTAYLEMLGLFIGQALSETTELQPPQPVPVLIAIDRPELRAFSSQQKVYDAQARLLHTKTLPRFSLFLQGGAGRPALNMLNNNFRFYYLGGIRLNWTLNNYYTHKREKDLLDLNREMIAVQKETFLFNTNLQLHQEASEIKKIQELLITDQKILALRTSVKTAASAQLENGVITVNDYLSEVLNEENARQQAILHHLQLLQAQYILKTTSGN